MPQKPGLLFLTHRIPYPPNKGDKVRSYHLLRFLSEHFDIYLASFMDDPNDWQYVNKVHSMCKDSVLFVLNPSWRRLSSIPALLGKKALSVQYYRHSVLQKWVKQCVDFQPIKACLVFSSVMGQFVLDYTKKLNTVVDFVDMDSEKWKQYAQVKSWPMSWVYRSEARRLFKFECFLSEHTNKSVFVSAQEAALFQRRSPDLADKITHIQNGVDVDYFDPDQQLENPYGQDRQVIVFTGAMDYWANEDAVCWYADRIWPKIKQQVKDAQFFIVGANPTKKVRTLGHSDGITVTGRVEDVRPYLKYAKLAIAPLRIARGIQNKVLEAFAMTTPVVASAEAMQGIEQPPESCFQVANNERDWVELSVSHLLSPNKKDKISSREFVLDKYTWDSNLKRFHDLLLDKA